MDTKSDQKWPKIVSKLNCKMCFLKLNSNCNCNCRLGKIAKITFASYNVALHHCISKNCTKTKIFRFRFPHLANHGPPCGSSTPDGLIPNFKLDYFYVQNENFRIIILTRICHKKSDNFLQRLTFQIMNDGKSKRDVRDWV